MENDKLSENEILDILKNKLVKGSSVNTLCEELNITDYDLFGYVKQLKDENINIKFTTIITNNCFYIIISSLYICSTTI